MALRIAALKVTVPSSASLYADYHTSRSNALHNVVTIPRFSSKGLRCVGPARSRTKDAPASSGASQRRVAGPRADISPQQQELNAQTLSPTSRLPGEDDGPSDVQRPAATASHAKLSLKDVDVEELKGRTVFVRVDVNVPLDDKGTITDDTRIRASLPTIEYLINVGARIVLASHLGRPKKGPEAKFSLKPVAARLSELLKKEVQMATDCVGPDVQKQIGSLKPGEVLLLENVRFHKEEEANDIEFSKQLATGIDFYVNDAFGTAHRAHASTAGIANYVSGRVAGFLLDKELSYLTAAIQKPPHPFVAIVGGSKISSKISVIESLMAKCDKVILGGGMVFTFFKAKGLTVGSSLVEEDKLELATRLTALAEQKGVDLILPSDVLCGDKFSAGADSQVCKSSGIPDGWMGLDIGPESISHFNDVLQSAKMVLWNGPMGVFEFEKFSKGTYAIAHTLAELTDRGCVTIIGGGDSVAAVEQAGVAAKMSHISTGGGASLELLEGKVLPGVAVLDDVRIHA